LHKCRSLVNHNERIGDKMRIKIDEKEYQIGALKAKGNTIVAGRAISWNGILAEGVEDITEYRTEIVEGEKVQVEVVPVESDIGR